MSAIYALYDNQHANFKCESFDLSLSNSAKNAIKKKKEKKLHITHNSTLSARLASTHWLRHVYRQKRIL